MKLKEIRYKRHKIRVIWEKCKDCLALYDPNISTLSISPKLSKFILGKILFHEVWHIICYLNNKDINKIGEENTAILAEEFAVVLSKNPTLKKLINSCV